ncbi:unnamed protein product [Thlaspi arvense]|uniref:SHSP domain-containing protein n=1 Tax=Thlaspi arvense TaxID=13288 RepID=A0AAU9RN37_THLAR|nr:unnamed protein product [Thlaspi arvense]
MANIHTISFCHFCSLHCSETGRLHTTNNPYQRVGPRGFIHVKILKKNKLYIRIDLPGVPDDAVHYRVDSVRQKIVFFSGETLDDGYEKKDGVREYFGTAGLGCDCCKITGVDATMKDGVLRMIVSRVEVKDFKKKCTLTVPPFTGSIPFLSRKSTIYGRSGTYEEKEDHPFMVKGRKGVINSGDRTADGGTYYSIDLPGVCSDDITVFPGENEVRFYVEIRNVYEHDEGGRIYMGAMKGTTPPHAPSYLTHDITWDAEYDSEEISVQTLKATPTGSDWNSNQ